ncbi:hypothetical protein CROSSROADS_48 [Mycobacterium phage Crossroads]|uniref:Uncharacterized protein n=4 Tax=Faithunavirus TaxID=2948705 RepID=A0A291I9V8_9CAUD|nr:hypothetical protein SEA_FAITH1_48 [Mycobacterium phage Faith1]YP_008410923.1 hypothetical protein N848_gp048 [Mycobacterium phage Crossroads]YP_009017273.1 hypothetical protein CL57_gp048 [Mycobacterium phage Rumpelstiltskin]YP_010012886.1 hypothetical protein J4T96_gp048 [Mycobacterium phage Finemlucis]YP_010013016.1 hypothetical protein J4T97_gp047 [Mycobacterium phage GuuelaD]AGK87611.1 hypothetical protein PBI_WINKY_48 [Mycobacterium phage Winky]AGM12657.1 hypothetical protein PBI_BRE
MTTTTSNPEREVCRLPSGDLTIKGTKVWLPSDPDLLEREREETAQRLRDILNAKRFLIEEQDREYGGAIDFATRKANEEVGRSNQVLYRDMPDRDKRWWIAFLKAVRHEGE